MFSSISDGAVIVTVGAAAFARNVYAVVQSAVPSLFVARMRIVPLPTSMASSSKLINAGGGVEADARNSAHLRVGRRGHSRCFRHRDIGDGRPDRAGDRVAGIVGPGGGGGGEIAGG